MPRKTKLFLCFLLIISLFSGSVLAAPHKPVVPAKPVKPVQPAKPLNPVVASPPAKQEVAPDVSKTEPPKPTPAPPDNQDWKPLARGDKGDTVKGLQKLLANAGFYAGEIDGKFGPITQESVQKVQKTYGLTLTGQADKTVINYLERAREKPDRYQRVMVMRTTAYTAQDPGCGSYTYRGNKVRPGLVAVDPAVIPLGTRLYIEGYGYAVADDIGSAIKGHRMDLAFENRKDAFKYGVRMAKVYIYD